MTHDRLLMNDDKTEFMIIGTCQQLSKLQPRSVSVNNSTIYPRRIVKNLGSWLDSHLKMSTHIMNVCKVCFFHLHNIRHIKKFLSKDSLLILIHAFITSKLDYCNSLLYWLPKKQISKQISNAFKMLPPEKSWIFESIPTLLLSCANYTGFLSKQEFTLTCYS